MTTTKYATWANVFGSLSPREDINNYAGEFAADFDLDAIEREYRYMIGNVIRECFPGTTLQLVGEEFIASWGEPLPADWASTLKQVVGETVELGPTFEAHDMIDDGW